MLSAPPSLPHSLRCTSHPHGKTPDPLVPNCEVTLGFGIARSCWARRCNWREAAWRALAEGRQPRSWAAGRSSAPRATGLYRSGAGRLICHDLGAVAEPLLVHRGAVKSGPTRSGHATGPGWSGQRPAPLLLPGRQVLLAHRPRLVHGLRDGGELELTTP